MGKRQTRTLDAAALNPTAQGWSVLVLRGKALGKVSSAAASDGQAPEPYSEVSQNPAALS